MPKKERTYANFGEYLFWSYANLQMLFVALKEGKPRYDRLCFMIRAKAFKAYKDGRWNIHDLFEFNIEKIRNNNYCWYCGQEVEPSKLTKDHVFPRSKGGANEISGSHSRCKCGSEDFMLMPVGTAQQTPVCIAQDFVCSDDRGSAQPHCIKDTG